MEAPPVGSAGGLETKGNFGRANDQNEMSAGTAGLIRVLREPWTFL